MLSLAQVLAIACVVSILAWGLRSCFAAIAARQRAVLRDAYEGLPPRQHSMTYSLPFLRSTKARGSPKEENVALLPTSF